MNKKSEEPEEKTLQEFNKRIKTYDTLSFLEDEKALLTTLTCISKPSTEQDTIAELTGIQLRALPLRR